MSPREQEKLADRVEAVRALVGMFKFERRLYISIIGISIVILLISALKLTRKPEFDYGATIGVFGPGGAIAMMTGRLLKMWNDATQLVSGKG